MAIKGLTPEQSEEYRKTILARESSGDYTAVNRLGYVGGYQMGLAALQEAGLVKKGITGGNAALDNPANWNIKGGKDTFLNSPDLQDKAFATYTNKNIDYLKKYGRIDDNTPPGDVAGYAAAAHLTGGPQVGLNGLGGKDANGVSNREYFGLGKAAVTGGSTSLPANATSKAASSTAKNATKAFNPGTPSFTGKTGVGNVVKLGKGGTPLTSPSRPKGKIKNPLEQFSSFNSIFTLSVLPVGHVNSPDDTYKKGDLGQIVLRSGGGFPDNRVKTAYTSSYNPDGKFDFFIDNITIDGIVGYQAESTGTNAINIEFEVFEPYSIGLFLQALKLASLEAKFPNYNEAPLLLTIQFVGYDSDGNAVPVDDVLDRHIPLKLQETSMKVNGSGCVYTISAYPWNELALTDQNCRFTQDMVISGSTVQEILQSGTRSLQYWVNSALEDIVKHEKPPEPENNTQGEGKATPQTNKSRSRPHEIAIVFPTILDSASNKPSPGENNKPLGVDPKNLSNNTNIETAVNLNRSKSTNLLIQDENNTSELGKSKMPFDKASGGTPPPPPEETLQSSKDKGIILRAPNSFNATEREFRFPQGTSIPTAITEIMLMSKYCQDAIINFNKGDKLGMIPWFRIETQVFVSEPSPDDAAKGESPKLFVYRVVPYYVHEHHFSSPTNQSRGYEERMKEAVKEYNYIYTGKNVDILNFDITIKNGAFTTLYADKGNLVGDLNPQINKSAANEGTTSVSVNTTPAASDGQLGSRTLGRQGQREVSKVGGPPDDHRTLIAKTFHQALISDQISELTEVKLEIMGDPYFIADSGMGNFVDKAVSDNLNENGSMNYQSGEVDVILNFRTPIDYNPDTGYADFGPTELVQGFSGLYWVTELKNHFTKGKFTQELTMQRRPNQDPEEVEAAKKKEEQAKKQADVAAPLTTTPEQKAKGTDKPLDAAEKGTKSPIADLWSETKKFFGL